MDYSRIASSYHLIERVTMGHALQQARICQLNRLAELASVRNALLVGEGDGSFLIAFAEQFPNAHVTVVEQSYAMIQRARDRFVNAGFPAERVSFIQADLLEVELPRAQFDFVTTLFFLDNFEDTTVRMCIDHIAASITDSAYWFVSDFCVPSHGWLRWRALLWLKVLYAFFKTTVSIQAHHLPDLEACLKASPLQLIDQKEHCGRMLFSALYQNQVK